MIYLILLFLKIKSFLQETRKYIYIYFFFSFLFFLNIINLLEYGGFNKIY